MKRKLIVILALAWLAQPIIGLATPPRTSEGGTSVPTVVSKIKLLKPLAQTQLAAVQTLDFVAPPQPEPTAPTPTAVINCGSDPNLAFIYQHESGCRTNAIGPNGPCGLGQALPCSKLPCSLNDWACQNAWFTQYALARYGSTYNAYLYWLSHSNW